MSRRNITVFTVVFYRQELYKDYSHQFLTLVMMWNIDVDQIKKQAGKLSVSIRLSFKGVHFLSIRGSNTGFLQQVWREGTGHELWETRRVVDVEGRNWPSSLTWFFISLLWEDDKGNDGLGARMVQAWGDEQVLSAECRRRYGIVS